MQNTVWFEDDQFPVDTLGVIYDDDQYIVEARLEDGQLLSLCMNPDAWEALVEQAESIGLVSKRTLLGIDDLDEVGVEDEVGF